MWPRTTKTSSRQVALREGFRSGLEQKAAAQLLAAGLPVNYESESIPYTIPARKARYTPDFILPNGIVVETKGRWVSDDRKKHKLIRIEHPTLDIRVVLMRPNSTIGKKSTTSYAKWADDHDVKWSPMYKKDAPIPPAWFDEPVNEKSLEALRQLRG